MSRSYRLALVLFGCALLTAPAIAQKGTPTIEPSTDPAAPTSSEAESVDAPKPGINDKFLDPDLDPEAWVERFEVESREAFAARHAVVRAVGLQKG